jgi:hypothetical protein
MPGEAVARHRTGRGTGSRALQILERLHLVATVRRGGLQRLGCRRACMMPSALRTHSRLRGRPLRLSQRVMGTEGALQQLVSMPSAVTLSPRLLASTTTLLTIALSWGSNPRAIHERAVYFQHIDREALQIRERRVASPEVVDGDANPKGSKLVQDPHGCAGVLHDDAFGYL